MLGCGVGGSHDEAAGESGRGYLGRLWNKDLKVHEHSGQGKQQLQRPRGGLVWSKGTETAAGSVVREVRDQMLLGLISFSEASGFFPEGCKESLQGI